ncbi:hypothetical protein FDC64_11275 [Clostridium botulinum]|uniref:C39 family peptidase n=1 Tax=Clostridium botulinum TaxID=1491 RepID=UPI00067D0FC2|nr:C39 family peptidase [Clostridium botulinum]MBY6773661.1 C39 family peptidase [Clostridium botulinum]MBY6864297.1 C39 family peptidase [Clostridium botulinum]MBY6984825.1 C39 family peptidase [Clostridium botulinum]NFP26138.1 hypothetical protein [Clostridium botulinum]
MSKKTATILFLIFFIFVVLFAPFFIITKTRPNVSDDVLNLYKEVVEDVNKEYKVSIDFRNLIAIDAVRYEQDFSKANKSNIKKLAKMFILKERYEIRYNLGSYEKIVSEINKKNGVNIDWREVVMVSALLNGEQFEFSGGDRIKSIANTFIRVKKIPQYYTVYETVTIKENYKEWENWFDGMPWLGGRWVTKTKDVKKKVAVKKVKYTEKKETKTISEVLKEKGYSLMDVPNKFKYKEKITTNMINKYETVYKVKDLDTVLDELGFTEQQKNDVHIFLQFGLSEFEGSGGEFGELEGTGERYTIPRFYQYDKRWAGHPYGESTIGQGGCGTTSFAMVATGMNPKNLKKMDRNNDGILDPVESSDWSASHGFKVPGNGTSWDFFAAASNTIGLNVKQLGKGDYNKVFNYLKDGNPVIASMSPGHFTRAGHFIVLTGVDKNNKIIVNDPASEARSKQTWDKQIVFNEAVQYWVFSKNMGSGTNYEITAYTGDPSENGGTAGRYAADGKTDLWKLNLSNRVIAVDPRKIKLGQKVYIEFPKEIRYVKLKDGKKFDLNGVYTAVDTGGDIKQNRIDLYVGFDGVNVKGYWYNLSNQIGRRKVKVYKDY